MTRILLILISFLFAGNAFAQPAWNYVVNGKVTFNSEQANLEGAVVSLSKNGSTVAQLVTKKGGKYTFVLDPDAEYTIAYTKAGFCTKRIYISTKNVPTERSKFGFANQPIDVDLFELPPDQNIVTKVNELLQEPMGKFVYVPSAQDFDFDEKYANEVKKKLKELLKIQKDIEKLKQDSAFIKSQVQNFTNAGNTLFNQGKFSDALTQYNEGLKLNPNDPNLLKKIEETKVKIKEEGDKQALRNQYLAYIKDADAFFKLSNWQLARDKYQAASNLFKEEPYPINQIKLCDAEIAKISAASELKGKYDLLIKTADNLYNSQKYNNAIAKYNEALLIFPKEQYPKDQIALCQKELDKISQNNQNKLAYQNAIKEGDDNFKLGKFDIALAAYTKATGLMPNEQYPKDQIALCNTELDKLKAQKELQAKYDAAVKEGDAAFKLANYNAAITAYNNALGIKPGEPYPKSQIDLCNKEIEKLKNAADAQAKYDVAIKDADAAFKASDWEGALALYNKALGYKPAEVYPKSQIILCNKEIERIKNAARDLAAQYDAAVKAGDAAFKLANWNGAIASYNKALGFKPGEQYPTGQIELCNKELGKIKDLQVKYDAAVKEGDVAFKASDWNGAITSYNAALGFKPAELYPKSQIILCNKELDKLKGAAELQAKYDAAVAEGDAALKSSNWSGAVTSYTRALSFKPGEQYPKDQIALCNKELEKIKALKDLAAQYDAAIKAADAAFKLSNWTGAIASYNKALGIKPGEQYPTGQIDLCNKELDKIKGQNELRAKYDAAVKEGDAAFQLSNWTVAIAAYNKALGFLPAEKYPVAQIDLCNKELEKIGANKALQAKYDAAIKEGDAAFKTSNWNAALTAYNIALGFKPLEPYPKAQIVLCNKEIDKLKNAADAKAKYDAAIKEGDAAFSTSNWTGAIAAYNKALGYQPASQYPKDQIVLCNKELEKIKNAADAKAKYDVAVKEGDAAFKLSNWNGAITAYTKALSFKPGEKYPTDQIGLCNVELDKIKGNKELQAKYDAAVKEGDAAFKSSNWTGAIDAYNKALGFKPAEKYPASQIDLCNKELEKIKNAGDVQAKYDLAIKNGDSNFNSTEYLTAKKFYEEAQNYKPAEKYPKDKLNEIANKLATLQRYNDAIAKADKLFNASDWKGAKAGYNAALLIKDDSYPKDQIKLCDEKLGGIENDKLNAQKYNTAIRAADKFYAGKDWKNALDKYTEALGYKPSDKYAQDRISELNAILAKIAEEDRKRKEEEELNKKYIDAVNAADVFFSKKDYVNAKTKYQEAQSYLPTQPYPPAMIKKCDDVLNVDPKLKEYNAFVALGDKAFKENRYKDAKGYYTSALEVKPEMKYPKDKLSEIELILKNIQNLQDQDAKILQYNSLIKEANTLYEQRNWNKAKIVYTQALQMQPHEGWPKERIAMCDNFMKPGNDPNKPGNNTAQTDAEYEKARKKRYNDLVAKHGGVGRYTIPEQSDGGKSVAETVIITDTDAFVYKKVVFKWGQEQYTKNDYPINAAEYEAAVNPQN